MPSFRKTDYFLIAEQMEISEIHPDVSEVLDKIARVVMTFDADN